MSTAWENGTTSAIEGPTERPKVAGLLPPAAGGNRPADPADPAIEGGTGRSAGFAGFAGFVGADEQEDVEAQARPLQLSKGPPSPAGPRRGRVSSPCIMSMPSQEPPAPHPRPISLRHNGSTRTSASTSSPQKALARRAIVSQRWVIADGEILSCAAWLM